MQSSKTVQPEGYNSSAPYHQLFQLTYDAIFVATIDGTIVDVNAAACELSRYTREELSRLNLTDILQLESPLPPLQALQEKMPQSFTGCNIGKNGSRIPLEIKIDSLRADAENLIIVIAHDLTDRQLATNVTRQNHYLKSLHDTTIGLVNQLDLTSLLKNIVAQACELFNTPDGYVCFPDGPDGKFAVSVGVGRYSDLIGYKFARGKGITGLAAEHGEPLIIEDYQNWSGRLNDSTWKNLQTGTGIPLTIADTVVGVLGVDFFDQPRVFTPDDMPILRRFAELASVALVNASLHSSLATSESALRQTAEKIREQNEYLTSLHDTTLGLMNQLDLDTLLNNILAHACKLFGTPDTFLYLADESADVLRIKIGTGRKADYVGYTVKIGHGVAGQALLSGQPYIIENYQNWAGRLPDADWDNLRTCVGIPLKTTDRIIGVLGLDFFDQPRSFSAEETPLLSHFAELASIAITNASLHSNLTNSEKLLQQKNEDLTAAHEELMASEEELRQQFNELIINEEEIHRQNIVLTALHHTALGLMNRLELSDLLNLIVTNATELLKTPHGVIDLFDAERGVPVRKVALGVFAQEGRKQFKTTDGLSGMVYRTGQLVALDDYQTLEGRLSDPVLDQLRACVLVPLTADGKTIGSLGLAFLTPARKFSANDLSLLSRFAELASIALDNATLVASYKKEIEQRQQTEEALRLSEASYRAIFEATNDPIYLYSADTFEILYINTKAGQNYGYTRAELIPREVAGQHTGQTLYSEAEAKSRLQKAAGGEPQQFEWIVQTRNGDIICEEVYAKKILIGNKECILEVSRDISQRKKNELELRKSEASNKALINAIPDPMFIMRQDGMIIDFKGSKERLRFPGNFLGKNITEVMPPEVAAKILKSIRMTIESQEIQVFEYELSRGKTEFFEARIVNSGDDEVLAIIRNITDRKSMEIQLKHLSLHDSLTGLYNRAYFEEGMKRLEGLRNGSAGLMICDVDGLKIINDTLGHNIGDIILKAVANILKNSFRSGDLVARIGGDEFAVLLLHNSIPIFEKERNKIRKQIEHHNTKNPTYPISLSIGFAVSTETPIDINNLFKEADNNMYREKLHRHKSGRSAIVQALMKALEARDFITEGHGDRLQGLIVAFASAIGLPEREYADLRLLAKFHDIGKVGIPDSILFKPGKLTEEEFVIMRQHCEIGYRIAKSAPDLVPIAEWILKHQEWWNGQGYPLGLSGQEIPLACRMLSIVDAFDAMTSDRPYRQALSRDVAIEELMRCAGTQFDPDLVVPFILVINKEASSNN